MDVPLAPNGRVQWRRYAGDVNAGGCNASTAISYTNRPLATDDESPLSMKKPNSPASRNGPSAGKSFPVVLLWIFDRGEHGGRVKRKGREVSRRAKSPVSAQTI